MAGIDKKTLRILKNGKMKGFESVYRLYNGRIYNFILSIVKDPGIAKDLTQDVFLLIWNKRKNINCENNFEGYLFKISRNMVYHYIRRELLLQNYLNRVEKESEPERLEIDKDLDYVFFEKYIMRLISELPEARKRIFMLYWKSELNYREIAKKLSISEKTVATQVQRSLHFLRAKIRNSVFGAILCLHILQHL